LREKSVLRLIVFPIGHALAAIVPKFGHPTQPNRRRQTRCSRHANSFHLVRQRKARPNLPVGCGVVGGSSSGAVGVGVGDVEQQGHGPMSRSRVPGAFWARIAGRRAEASLLSSARRVQDVDVRTVRCIARSALPREAGHENVRARALSVPCGLGNPATSERSFVVRRGCRHSSGEPPPVPATASLRASWPSGADRHGQELGRLYRSGGSPAADDRPSPENRRSGRSAGPGPQVAGGFAGGVCRQVVDPPARSASRSFVDSIRKKRARCRRWPRPPHRGSSGRPGDRRGAGRLDRRVFHYSQQNRPRPWRSGCRRRCRPRRSPASTRCALSGRVMQLAAPPVVPLAHIRSRRSGTATRHRAHPAACNSGSDSRCRKASVGPNQRGADSAQPASGHGRRPYATVLLAAPPSLVLISGVRSGGICAAHRASPEVLLRVPSSSPG